MKVFSDYFNLKQSWDAIKPGQKGAFGRGALHDLKCISLATLIVPLIMAIGLGISKLIENHQQTFAKAAVLRTCKSEVEQRGYVQVYIPEGEDPQEYIKGLSPSKPINVNVQQDGETVAQFIQRLRDTNVIKTT